MANIETTLSGKSGAAQVEKVPDKIDATHEKDLKVANTDVLVKSKLDTLSLGQTAWTFRRVLMFSLMVYTGFVCEGFELKIGNNIIANKGFIRQFGRKGGEGVQALNSSWVSTWTSLLNVGQIVTFLYIHWFSDRFGRKPAFFLSWLWLAVGCILLNTAKTPGVWAVGKLCNGAGVGILQVTCQVYVMEIVPNRIRGGVLTFQAVWSNIGNILCNVMMERLNKHHPYNYTLPLRILIAPIALMIFFYAFIPESPWFYARRGDKEKALKSMRRLYSNVEGYNFEEEYEIVARTIQHEKDELAETPNILHCFKGLNLRRTLTVMLLSVSSQFGGLSVVLTYSTYFFSIAGLTNPFLGTLILSCCNLLAVLLWTFTTDTVGRRRVITIAQTLICCFLFIVGSLWWAGATTGYAPASNALLVICCLWSFTFQAVNMAYFVMSPEIPSALLRVKTVPITFFAQSILGITFGFATPPMLLKLNIKACFVYGALSVPCCILMWLFVPETKGRSAAEIDQLYEARVPAWKWSKTVTDAEKEMHAALLVDNEKSGDGKDNKV